MKIKSWGYNKNMKIKHGLLVKDKLKWQKWFRTLKLHQKRPQRGNYTYKIKWSNNLRRGLKRRRASGTETWYCGL